MRDSLPAKVLIGAVRAYQLAISPWLPPSCRFYPTCSRYALDALRERGAIVGTLLTVWRLLRCHPFHPGGYDPVPHRHPTSAAPQR